MKQFNEEKQKWVDLPRMREGRMHFGVGVLADHLYAIGGASDDSSGLFSDNPVR